MGETTTKVIDKGNKNKKEQRMEVSNGKEEKTW